MPDTQSSSLTPDSFMQSQQPAVTPESFMAGANPVATATPDALQTVLNYHTGSALADLPLGLVQGAAKGLASTGYGLIDLANKVVPNPVQLNPDYRASITQPSGIGQGTGKFLEQGAEFALPSMGASKLLEAAPFLARAGAQAGIGAGVSAAQSGGDKTAMAVGGILGGLGEVGGAAVKAIGAPKELNPQMLKEAFQATPRQMKAVNRALDTLKADGFKPGNLQETAGAVDAKLNDLRQEYAALPADIPNRTIDPYTVIGDLQKEMRQYQRGEVTSAENAPLVKAIQSHIDTAEMLAAQRPDGLLSFDDLKYLRDSANNKVNWQAPEAEQNLYRGLGDVDRKYMDKLAPGTADLNRRWSEYEGLKSVAQHNLSFGKGDTKSFFTQGLERTADREIGAAIGAGLGSHIPGGEYVGSLIGSVAYPRLAKPAVEALQSAANSGALKNLGGTQLNTLVNAMKRSDTQAILKALGKGSTFETLTQTAPATP